MKLRDRFRPEGYSTFPKAYQVFVRCRTDNHLLLSCGYEGHRVIDEQKK